MVTTYPAVNASLPLRGAPAIRHIILPLDGGKLAEKAVEPVSALAHAFGADVMLVRCFELDEHKPAGHAALTLPINKFRMPLHMASLYLAHMEERFRERGITVHSHLYQWPVGLSTLDDVQRYADALVVIAVQTGALDVPRLCEVVADISDGAQVPVLFIPVDWRSPFAGGHLRSLRALAVNGDGVPEVAAYARTLAEAFQGTTVKLSSRISSVVHEVTPVTSNVSDDGRTTGNAVHNIHQLVERIGAAADVVVMSAAAQLGGSWDAVEDACAFDAFLSAGVALLVVP